jgi:formimidoylglutamate deiminase
MRYLAPAYLLTASGLKKNQLLTIDDDGIIVSIENHEQPAFGVDERINYLLREALLPGFVNGHSHVFQRFLRGRTHRPISRKDSFWTWRRKMYQEANQLTPDSLYRVALHTYREMLSAGYTSVGEFHYVHHQVTGEPYANPNAMSEAVLRAGKAAGIRVVLLMVAYARGGINQPPEEEQRRFCDASVEDFLARVDALRSTGVPVGIAPHSIRAVPEDWLRPLAAYSQSHNLPFHIHVDEQRAEIKQCLDAYGCTPIELLERYEVLDARTTIIHATHANEAEIEILKKRRATVCVCPTTEGDLGDGIAPYAELVAAGIPLAIGADSNVCLSPFEELRWAEYTARMRYERRRILIADPLASPGPFLLDMGTRNGARSLGLNTGVIAPGMQADFVAINLKHPMVAGCDEDDLLDTLFFGVSSEVIDSVWVQGKKVV